MGGGEAKNTGGRGRSARGRVQRGWFQGEKAGGKQRQQGKVRKVLRFLELWWKGMGRRPYKWVKKAEGWGNQRASEGDGGGSTKEDRR